MFGAGASLYNPYIHSLFAACIKLLASFPVMDRPVSVESDAALEQQRRMLEAHIFTTDERKQFEACSNKTALIATRRLEQLTRTVLAACEEITRFWTNIQDHEACYSNRVTMQDFLKMRFKEEWENDPIVVEYGCVPLDFLEHIEHRFFANPSIKTGVLMCGFVSRMSSTIVQVCKHFLLVQVMDCVMNPTASLGMIHAWQCTVNSHRIRRSDRVAKAIRVKKQLRSAKMSAD